MFQPDSELLYERWSISVHSGKTIKKLINLLWLPASVLNPVPLVSAVTAELMLGEQIMRFTPVLYLLCCCF